MAGRGHWNQKGEAVRLAGWLRWLLPCMAGLAGVPAAALDPGLNIAQYKHSKWSVEDGAPTGIVALAQGRDGYLWIGDYGGLIRFDGISFEHITLDRPPQQRSSATALLVARDGSVWAGFSTGGIARYRGGVLRDMGVPNARAYVMALVEAADGAVWAELGAAIPQFARFANGRWTAVGENWGLPREPAINVLAARDGTLWVTTERSLHFLKSGSRRFQRLSVGLTGHAALSEDLSGRIWLSDSKGTRAVTGGTATRIAYPTPPFPRAARTFFDRDGNLWGVSRQAGIYRLRSPKPGGAPTAAEAAAQISMFQQHNGLLSDDVFDILEDREGNIWVGSSLGLDRFRSAGVVVEPLLTHVPMWGDVLLAASDGSVYVGEAPGVYRIPPEGVPRLVLSGAGESEAMCEGPDGAIWMIQAKHVVRFGRGRTASLPRPPSRQAVIDCAVSRNNMLWLTATEGLFRWTEAGWRLQTMPGYDEASGNMPIIAGRDGRLLVYASTRSLRRIDFPRFTDFTLSRPGSLRDLRTIYEGTDSLLLGGRFGLARVRDRRVRFIGPGRVAAFAFLTGIAQTPAGDTWTMGSQGILRTPTATLERAFDDPRSPLHPQSFDFRDGLPANSGRDGKRDIVRGGDGRLWFATTAGTVWIDPARLKRNGRPPPVAIAALRAGGTIYRDPIRLSLPAGTAAAEIDYAALSLSIPDRVQVRYRLEGADADWLDPGMRRQSFYTNLGPGTYRFRVIAANNDGVWNREGATLEFTIAPTFFQSNWFLLLCLLGLGLLAWLAYSFRVRQLTARVRAALEVRLAERERIARELHDTLLQSFQGLVLRFQAVAERIPAGQPLRPVIDQALDRAEEALVEGRNRVRELRAASGDLAQALAHAAEERSVDSATRFNLTIEGRPRALHPMARDEVERIGTEAIRNAFLHAHAREIEAVLTYRSGELRFDLRDDGIGLPVTIAEGGVREGHYGLTGMRERARRIGGTLTFKSREMGGTEVALSIPGRSAYAGKQKRWRLPLPAHWREL